MQPHSHNLAQCQIAHTFTCEYTSTAQHVPHTTSPICTDGQAHNHGRADPRTRALSEPHKGHSQTPTQRALSDPHTKGTLRPTQKGTLRATANQPHPHTTSPWDGVRPAACPQNAVAAPAPLPRRCPPPPPPRCCPPRVPRPMSVGSACYSPSGCSWPAHCGGGGGGGARDAGGAAGRARLTPGCPEGSQPAIGRRCSCV